jgi:hypothetical protein
LVDLSFQYGIFITKDSRGTHRLTSFVTEAERTPHYRKLSAEKTASASMYLGVFGLWRMLRKMHHTISCYEAEQQLLSRAHGMALALVRSEAFVEVLKLEGEDSKRLADIAAAETDRAIAIIVSDAKWDRERESRKPRDFGRNDYQRKMTDMRQEKWEIEESMAY